MIDTAIPIAPTGGSAIEIAVMSGSTAPVRVTQRPGSARAAPTAVPSSGTCWPTHPTWRIARGLSQVAT